MQAACGLAQIKKIESFIDARRKNFEYLSEGLKDLDFLQLTKPTDNSNPSWFGFPMTVTESSPISRNELIEFLEEKRIGTRLLFAGNLLKQPYFQKDVNYRVDGELTNTDLTMKNTFWIGVQPSLTKEMLDYVIEQFHKINQSKN